MDLKRLHRLYDEYVDGFKVDGKLSPMMELKRIHTAFVVRNAKEIAAGEGFDLETAEVCEAAALLHDTGRYEQLKRYNTFRDSDSVDHAVFSHDIVKARSWLAGEPHVDAILKAVLYHNRRDLPEGLDPLTLTAAHCTRDADKLDIYRVLSPYLTPDGVDKAPKFIKADASQLVSPDFVRDFAEGKQADYHRLRTHGDRKLVRLMWVYDINYSWTLRKMVERGYVDLIIKYLPEQEGLAVGIQRLQEYIKKKCAAKDRVDL